MQVTDIDSIADNTVHKSYLQNYNIRTDLKPLKRTGRCKVFLPLIGKQSLQSDCLNASYAEFSSFAHIKWFVFSHLVLLITIIFGGLESIVEWVH